MGWDVKDGGGGYQLREGAASHKALFRPEKRDIDPKKTYFLNINYE